MSVLEKHFVEIQEPCASSTAFYVEERPNSVIWIGLSSVPTKKLAEVEKKVIEVLRKTANEPLDMSYLLDCLRREKRRVKFYVDLSGNYLSRAIITDFLFGERDASTLRELETLNTYDHLEKWGDKEWRDFLKKWISDAHYVAILGQPSANLSKKIKEDEVNSLMSQSLNGFTNLRFVES